MINYWITYFQIVSDFIRIWADLALCFEGFLFPASKPPSTQTLEEQQFDESLDVRVVELIRDSIMPFAAQIPKEFVLQIVSLLNKGSIHSATNSSPVGQSFVKKLFNKSYIWIVINWKIQNLRANCVKSSPEPVLRLYFSFHFWVQKEIRGFSYRHPVMNSFPITASES